MFKLPPARINQLKTPFITDLPRPEPRGLQTQNWERKRGRVGPATQQRLQLQTVRLPEELLRVLRGGFQEPFPSNCLGRGQKSWDLHLLVSVLLHGKGKDHVLVHL